MRNVLAVVWRRLRRRPAPRVFVNLWLAVRWRCIVHPAADIQFPGSCVIARGARVGRCTIICRGGTNHPAVRLGRVVIHDGVILDALEGAIEVGDDTALNPYCVLYGTGGLRIGRDCGIATHTVMVAANHSFERLDLPMMRQPIRAQGIRVGDDVWIGAGCTILDGVEVAAGSIVAAGAVVTQSFPPRSILAGVPARLVRRRSDLGGSVDDPPEAMRG